MASPAEWVATSLKKHTSVKRARVVRDDCVEIERKDGYPTVTVRVVNTTIELADVERIGIGVDHVDAIVSLRKNRPYSWDAKTAARERGHDLYFEP